MNCVGKETLVLPAVARAIGVKAGVRTGRLPTLVQGMLHDTGAATSEGRRIISAQRTAGSAKMVIWTAWVQPTSLRAARLFAWKEIIRVMLFDPSPQGGPAWEPLGPLCKSCNRPIAHDEPIEFVHFERRSEEPLRAMNGLYHADCAQPLVKLACVLDALSSDPVMKR